MEESVGWFVMAERVAEIHVKEPHGRLISDEAAALAASTLALTPSDGGCSNGSSGRSFPIARWSTEQRARPWTRTRRSTTSTHPIDDMSNMTYSRLGGVGR